VSEKIDALDFVINVLREHEKRLDEAVYKLELLVNRLEKKGQKHDK